MIEPSFCPDCEQVVLIVETTNKRGRRSIREIPGYRCTGRCKPGRRTIAWNPGRRDEWLDREEDGSLTYHNEREDYEITASELVKDHPGLAAIAIEALLKKTAG